MTATFDFKDSNVFVFGGTSGINLGIARCFAAAGAAVAVPLGDDLRAVYEVGPGPVLAFIANAVVPEPGDGAAVAAEAIAEAAVAGGWGLYELTPQRATLEDVFVHITTAESDDTEVAA